MCLQRRGIHDFPRNIRIFLTWLRLQLQTRSRCEKQKYLRVEKSSRRRRQRVESGRAHNMLGMSRYVHILRYIYTACTRGDGGVEDCWLALYKCVTSCQAARAASKRCLKSPPLASCSTLWSGSQRLSKADHSCCLRHEKFSTQGCSVCNNAIVVVMLYASVYFATIIPSKLFFSSPIIATRGIFDHIFIYEHKIFFRKIY